MLEEHTSHAEQQSEEVLFPEEPVGEPGAERPEILLVGFDETGAWVSQSADHGSGGGNDQLNPAKRKGSRNQSSDLAIGHSAEGDYQLQRVR